jgi:DNA polymerase elongation subunit (family B)
MAEPKIVLFDLETSLIEYSGFTLYPDSIPHSSIRQDWYIICGCWKELSSKRINSVSVSDDPARYKKNHKDDYHVVKTLHEVMSSADVVIAHNLKKFDMRKLNARIVYHKLPPLPPFLLVDTLTEARKIANFTSNRLDYLAKHLGYKGKMPTTAGLWMDVMDGNKRALDEMVRYCKNDVDILEFVYLRLRPYIRNHPNINTFTGKILQNGCPSCGSTKLTISKTRYTASGLKRIQKICRDCHSYSTHLK